MPHAGTADFTEAERLFTEARALAARDGDREGKALAITGLGMTRHGRNITRLVSGAALSDADGAAEDELMRRAPAAWRETGDTAGTARALFGVSLVFQVLHRDAYRAVELARAVGLLPWRIRDAEQILAQAEAAVRAAG